MYDRTNIRVLMFDRISDLMPPDNLLDDMPCTAKDGEWFQWDTGFCFKSPPWIPMTPALRVWTRGGHWDIFKYCFIWDFGSDPWTLFYGFESLSCPVRSEVLAVLQSQVSLTCFSSNSCFFFFYRCQRTAPSTASSSFSSIMILPFTQAISNFKSCPGTWIPLISSAPSSSSLHSLLEQPQSTIGNFADLIPLRNSFARPQLEA